MHRAVYSINDVSIKSTPLFRKATTKDKHGLSSVDTINSKLCPLSPKRLFHRVLSTAAHLPLPASSTQPHSHVVVSTAICPSSPRRHRWAVDTMAAPSRQGTGRYGRQRLRIFTQICYTRSPLDGNLFTLITCWSHKTFNYNEFLVAQHACRYNPFTQRPRFMGTPAPLSVDRA